MLGNLCKINYNYNNSSFTISSNTLSPWLMPSIPLLRRLAHHSEARRGYLYNGRMVVVNLGAQI